jgi:lipoate-protein ligase A
MTVDGRTWRLIDTGPLSGPENMAIDAALLDCFVPGESLPVLRLYGWEPPAFSYGRFQRVADIIDLEKCRENGIAVVRRITGGGVIYHAAELTYSLACPTDFVGNCRSVKDAFFHLTSFLLGFYRELGLDPVHAVDHFGGARQLGGRTPLCFAGIESCDILLAGKKIGGNAQRRLKNAIFQHGSIPLQQMAGAGGRYLHNACPEVISGTTSLADAGIDTARAALARQLAAAFATTFAVTLHPDELSAGERTAASRYMQETA